MANDMRKAIALVLLTLSCSKSPNPTAVHYEQVLNPGEAAQVTSDGVKTSMTVIHTAHARKQSEAIEWEHGWETPNVVATRYENDLMGYNIGFVFPNDLNNGDRPELFEFIEKCDGFVFEGGGYSGAPLYTKFKGVVDKDTANEKLKTILPELDR